MDSTDSTHSAGRARNVASQAMALAARAEAAGDPRGGLVALEGAIEELVRAGDVANEAVVLVRLAAVQRRVGDAGAALHSVERARGLLSSLPRAPVVLPALRQAVLDAGVEAAVLAVERGDHDEALAILDDLRGDLDWLGLPAAEATVELHLGRVYLDLGEAEAALGCFEVARAGSEAVGDHLGAARAGAHRVEAMLVLGLSVDALEEARAAAEALEERLSEDPGGVSRVEVGRYWMLVAETLRASGLANRARQVLLERALPLLGSTHEVDRLALAVAAIELSLGASGSDPTGTALPAELRAAFALGEEAAFSDVARAAAGRFASRGQGRLMAEALEVSGALLAQRYRLGDAAAELCRAADVRRNLGEVVAQADDLLGAASLRLGPRGEPTEEALGLVLTARQVLERARAEVATGGAERARGAGGASLALSGAWAGARIAEDVLAEGTSALLRFGVEGRPGEVLWRSRAPGPAGELRVELDNGIVAVLDAADLDLLELHVPEGASALVDALAPRETQAGPWDGAEIALNAEHPFIEALRRLGAVMAASTEELLGDRVGETLLGLQYAATLEDPSLRPAVEEASRRDAWADAARLVESLGETDRRRLGLAQGLLAHPEMVSSLEIDAEAARATADALAQALLGVEIDRSWEAELARYAQGGVELALRELAAATSAPLASTVGGRERPAPGSPTRSEASSDSEQDEQRRAPLASRSQAERFARRAAVESRRRPALGRQMWVAAASAWGPHDTGMARLCGLFATGSEPRHPFYPRPFGWARFYELDLLRRPRPRPLTWDSLSWVTHFVSLPEVD